jgi:predicted small secreted protein
MLDRSRASVAAIAAALLLLALPVAGCDRDNKKQVEKDLERAGKQADRQLDELGNKAEKAWEDAKPHVEKGMRDAGKAVGKGIEVAGEAIQKGGEELQKEARDTSQSTLPDTVTKDTMILKKGR